MSASSSRRMRAERSCRGLAGECSESSARIRDSGTCLFRTGQPCRRGWSPITTSPAVVSRRVRVYMRFAAAILIFAMLGCTELDPKPLVAAEGTWVLESLNGAPVPATMPGGAELLGSTFMAGDGLFTRTSTIRAATSQSPSQIVQTGGYYCGRVACGPRTGLLIFHESGNEAQATIDGASLTISEPDLVWVYRRP